MDGVGVIALNIIAGRSASRKICGRKSCRLLCSVLCFTRRCKTVQRSYTVRRGALYLVGAMGPYFGPLCLGWLISLKAIHPRRVENTIRNIIDSV